MEDTNDVPDANVTVRERAKVLAAEVPRMAFAGSVRDVLGLRVTVTGRVTAVHEDGVIVVTPEAVSH